MSGLSKGEKAQVDRRIDMSPGDKINVRSRLIYQTQPGKRLDHEMAISSCPGYLEAPWVASVLTRCMKSL